MLEGLCEEDVTARVAVVVGLGARTVITYTGGGSTDRVRKNPPRRYCIVCVAPTTQSAE